MYIDSGCMEILRNKKNQNKSMAVVHCTVSRFPKKIYLLCACSLANFDRKEGPALTWFKQIMYPWCCTLNILYKYTLINHSIIIFKVTRNSSQIMWQIETHYLKSRNLFPTSSVNIKLHHHNKISNTLFSHTSWIPLSNVLRIRCLR